MLGDDGVDDDGGVRHGGGEEDCVVVMFNGVREQADQMLPHTDTFFSLTMETPVNVLKGVAFWILLASPLLGLGWDRAACPEYESWEHGKSGNEFCARVTGHPVHTRHFTHGAKWFVLQETAEEGGKRGESR